MLLESYNILNTNQDILDKYVSRFRFILIDETQDMNHAQNEIIKLLGKPNNNVFIVNDPLQNIYNWRGSDNKYVLKFHKDWDNVTVINLDTNYRSAKDIVVMSNKFASTIEVSKHEFYVESHTDAPYYKTPMLFTYKDEFDEADNIADQINNFISAEQYSFKDFCVLARTNAQLQTFETSFYNKNIAYEIVDGNSFIERVEIKIVLSYLRLANDVYDNESFEYIYYRPNRWLGKAFLEECKKAGDKSLFNSMEKAVRSNPRFRDGVEELKWIIGLLKKRTWDSVGEQIKCLRKNLDIDGYISKDIQGDGNESEKVENINSLEKIATRFKTLDDFLEYINKLSIKKNTDNNYVKLSTIHKSKGLEFPVVFLTGLNDTLLPHHRSDNIEEEKRLAYVAMTRAEKELYCSYVEIYQDKQLEPSPFIKNMFGNIFMCENNNLKKKQNRKNKNIHIRQT